MGVKATLYNKKKPVLNVILDQREVTELQEVCDYDFLPVALQNHLDLSSINQWMKKRLIPANREGLSDAVAIFGEKIISENNRCMFSLTDQYWFRFSESETWGRMNFFTNPYHSALGDAFFTPWDVDAEKLLLASPDITTNGALRKTWVQDDNLQSFLIKAGSTVYAQEPLSEVLTSMLLNKIKIIDFVRYDLYVHGLRICSRCQDFVTEDTEFIPAKHIYDREPKPSGVTVYDHLLRMCKYEGLQDSAKYLDKMILADLLIGNCDRHLGNFGFLRDVTSGVITGFSPLFDFGSAFWEYSQQYRKKPKNKIFADQEERVLRQYRSIPSLQRLNKTEPFFRVIDKYPDLATWQKQAIKEGMQERLKLIRLTANTRGAFSR